MEIWSVFDIRLEDNEWRRVQSSYRTHPDVEIKGNISENIPNSLEYLINLIKDNTNDAVLRCRGMVWLVSLYGKLYREDPKVKVFYKKRIMDTLKEMVISNISTTINQTREDALIAIVFILNSQWEENPEDVAFLFKVYDGSISNDTVRNDVLSAFSRYKNPKVAEPLALAILEGKYEDIHHLSQSLQELSNPEWSSKAMIYFKLIEQNPIISTEINANTIINSLGPSWGEDSIKRFVDVGNLIIKRARNADDRVADIYSKLLLQSVGGDKIIAGHRINEFQKNNNIPIDELVGLRKNVGGSAALTGLIEVKSDEFTSSESARHSKETILTKTTILFVAADPIDTQKLRIYKEASDIKEGLRRSNKGNMFDFKIQLATKPRDLSRAILNEKPQILHFSGHGETEGIILENDRGKARLVETKALKELFSLFSDTIKCVFLNSCLSENQALEISRHIPYVIGMSKAIPDSTAIAFAISFYDAIGEGRDFEFAFKFGKANIGLEGLTGKKIPILLKDGKQIIY